MRQLVGAALAATALCFALARGAAAQEYTVIINQAVPATGIAASELGRIFEKRAIRWSNGLGVDPVDQASSSPIRARFCQDVLGKTVAQAQAYWQAQVFAGRAVPPVELATDALVIQYVATHAGAVGYVSAGIRLPDDVRRLDVTP